MAVIVGEVFLQRGDQVRDAVKDPAAQALHRQVAKETLDHIQPGGAGRGEVQMKTRMFLQPGFDLGMFVRGLVIQDQMQVAIRGSLPIELLEELEPFLMPVARLALRDDLPSGDVQGGEERRGSMPDIVVGQRARSTLLEGSARLRPIQRLHLTLFIAAEHDGMLWCGQVKADDILQLFGKERVIGHLEGAEQMRLEPMLTPDAPHRAGAQVHRFSHGRPTPMRLSRRRAARRLADEQLPDLGRVSRLASTPRRIVLDARTSRFRKARPPAPHHIFGKTKLRRDLLIPLPAGRQQDNPATFRKVPWRQRTLECCLQPRSINVSQ